MKTYLVQFETRQACKVRRLIEASRPRDAARKVAEGRRGCLCEGDNEFLVYLVTPERGQHKGVDERKDDGKLTLPLGRCTRLTVRTRTEIIAIDEFVAS